MRRHQADPAPVGEIEPPPHDLRAWHSRIEDQPSLVEQALVVVKSRKAFRHPPSVFRRVQDHRDSQPVEALANRIVIGQ
jgi:hypothetical protein